MRTLITTVSSLAIAGSAFAQVSVALIEEDFSSASFTTGTKFTDSEINGGWHKRSSNGPAWEISGEALTNPQLVNNDDKPAFILNSLSVSDTSLNQITVSFDYSVAAGSTLFFHSALMTGATNGTLNAGVSQSDGTYAGAQYGTGFDGGALNLKDGSNPVNNDANSIAAIVGNAGPNVGTFTQTFDISGYPGITNIAEVSHILAVFASNNAVPGGAISIDNFSVIAEVGTGTPLVTSTWDGDATANWSLNINWLGDSLPAALDKLIFAGEDNLITNNDFTAGTEFNGLSFTNAADAESFSLGGNSITLGGDIFLASASVSITDVISLDMALNGDRAVNSGTDHNLEVSGIISEDASARSLSKSGPGTFILTAANTYTGATLINGGTLQIGNGGTSGSLSPSSAITNNGDLLFTRSDDLTQGSEFSAAPIDGLGTLSKWGANTLTLTAANTYTGRTILGFADPSTVGGTLNIQNDAALGTGLLDFQDGATFELGVDGLTVSNAVTVFNRSGLDQRVIRLDLPGTTTGALTGAIDIRLAIVDAFAVEVGADDTLTMSGLISNVAGGGAGLTKIGDGTLIVNNSSNSYMGNTTVTAGTLSLGDGALETSLSDTADAIVATGAELNLNFTSTDIIRSLFIGGVQVSVGTYSAADFSELTGAGLLEVTTGPPPRVGPPNIIAIEVDSSGNVVLTLDGSEVGVTVQQSDDLSVDSFTDIVSTSGVNALIINSADVNNTDGKNFYRVRN